MLRLTATELSTALAGLSAPERRELLELLEGRELAEAEKPQDTRPPLRDYLSPATAAEQAHHERLGVHLKRLQSERPLAADADARGYLHWSLELWRAAGEAADRDGYRAVPPAAAPPEPPDEHPLPAATAHDIEVSRALERARRSASVEPAPAVDKLAAYRGFGEWHLPPSHTDD